MYSFSKLIRTALATQRYCVGRLALTICDVLQYFPELKQFVGTYLHEIEIFKQGIFPTTPKEPLGIYEADTAQPGNFMRLPKQYRRFFARVENGSGWRSFKGFDPQLGYRIAHNNINIRRGADSPWGMKWLSGQIYTAILTWAIHAEHVKEFGSLAPLPLPICIVNVEQVFWNENLQNIERIDLGGNRNYPWVPGQTDYCLTTRYGIVKEWIEAMPKGTIISQAISEQLNPQNEGLGGVIYDMNPFLRLEMPVFFSEHNEFQHTNYTLALEKQLTETSLVTEATLAYIAESLKADTEQQAKNRAANLGTLLGICQNLKINILSFGVESSNIAIDGSLPDLDTIQYRADSIEWLSGKMLPPTVDFRCTGIVQNLRNFEALKESQGFSRLSDYDTEKSLAQGLYITTGQTYIPVLPANGQCLDATAVMKTLDGKLTVANTINGPWVPCYRITEAMSRPEGFTFLRCIGTGNNPAEVWFTLATLGEFSAMEVHHRDNNGRYERLPGDYFHLSLNHLPRSFFDYIEEYIRLFLNGGISEIVFYPDMILSSVGEGAVN